MDKALEKGFERYYNTISKIGYIPRSSINKLIVASWIRDAINGKYDRLLSQEEYNILDNLYSCIEGTCLVPYRRYCQQVTINKVSDNTYVRVTEVNTENTQRLLEINELRMI